MKRNLKAIIAVVIALALLTLALSSLVLADVTTTPTESRSGLPPVRPANPSSGVYTQYDTVFDDPEVSYAWIEINATADFAWDLQEGYDENDVSPRSYPIGFFFPFYNDFYSEFRVSERGYILFEKPGVNVGTGQGLPVPNLFDTIPNAVAGSGNGANNFIAPFAGTLFGYPGVSQVYVRNDTSPRRTIIQFENMVWCCSINNPRTFQVILYPNGHIQMQYKKVANYPGEEQTEYIWVGLENLDGSAGDVYVQGLFNPNGATYWQDRMAIRYERELSDERVIFLPDSERVWDDPGRAIELNPQLYLLADPAVTRDFTIMTDSLVVSSSVPVADWADNITHTTDVSNLAGTFSSTVQVVLTVPVGADFSDIATATFIAESTVPPLLTDTFTVVYGPAHRDLQIEKRLDPETAPTAPPFTPQGAFRYRLVATNTDFNNSNRAGLARQVVIADLLPSGVTYEDCRLAPTDWRPCSEIGTVTTATLGVQTLVTVTVSEMAVDQVHAILLELRNSNPAGSPVNNTAGITTLDSIELGYPYKNSDTADFNVASVLESELYVDKHYWDNHDHRYVAAGQPIPFDIYFYNNGNNPLDPVEIVDLIPEGTTFYQARLWYRGPALAPEGPITPLIGDPDGRTLTFTLPADNGRWNDAHIRLWVNVPQTMPVGTRLTNTVDIAGAGSTDDDSAWVEIGANYVDPFVDKGLPRDVYGNVILPEPGKDYTYWITYGNRSVLTDATDFSIVDTLPAPVSLVSASAARYLTGPFTSTVAGQTVIEWYTDTLRAGQMGRAVVVIHVPEDLPGGTVLTNQISVDYTGSFTPSTTVDDTDVVTVEVASDIVGSRKEVDTPTTVAGSIVEYTLAVSNTGPLAAFNVSDSLPAELSYVAHDPPSAGVVTVSPDDTITWSGNVGANEEVTLRFRARVTTTAQLGDVIRNTASIEAGGGQASLIRWVDISIVGGTFGNSAKGASPEQVPGGGQVTYVITATNSGTAGEAVTVTDSIPLSTSLVGGSFNPSEGSVVVSDDNRVFTWTPTVAAEDNETLSFRVTVTEGVTNGVKIDNIAYLDVGGTTVIPLTATVTISNSASTGGDIFLPVILKQS